MIDNKHSPPGGLNGPDLAAALYLCGYYQSITNGIQKTVALQCFRLEWYSSLLLCSLLRSAVIASERKLNLQSLFLTVLFIGVLSGSTETLL